MRRRLCASTVLAIVLSTSAGAMPLSWRDSVDGPEDGRPAAEAAWWSVAAEGSRHAAPAADAADLPDDDTHPSHDGARTSALVLTLMQARRATAPTREAAAPEMLQRHDDEVAEPEQAASSVSRTAYSDPSNRLFGEGLVGLVGAERHNAVLAEARQWFAAARDVVSMDTVARPVDPAAVGPADAAKPELQRERLIPAELFEFVRSNRQGLLAGVLGALVLALVAEAMRPRRKGRATVHRVRLDSERRQVAERRARSGDHPRDRHRERHREHHGERRSHTSRRERGERRAAQAVAR